MNKKNFECYSHKLMKFLLENGVVPFSVTKHNKTEKTMWIYEKGGELDRLLTIWSNKANS